MLTSDRGEACSHVVVEACSHMAAEACKGAAEGATGGACSCMVVKACRGVAGGAVEGACSRAMVGACKGMMGDCTWMDAKGSMGWKMLGTTAAVVVMLLVTLDDMDLACFVG